MHCARDNLWIHVSYDQQYFTLYDRDTRTEFTVQIMCTICAGRYLSMVRNNQYTAILSPAEVYEGT